MWCSYNKKYLILNSKFRGCILGGAIGDAYGSGFENQVEEEQNTYYLFGKPESRPPSWQITDDTQLTLLTCEVLIENQHADPGQFAQKFLKYYQSKRLRGLGASTLKALRELNVGGHWSLVGSRGEYAAGNGAAMRIAPLAFYPDITNSQVREICSITHHNDEAYVGALSVIIAIRAILEKEWTGHENLLEIIIDQIPDTRVRDRLIELKNINSIDQLGTFGTSGYVVDSVPFSIAMANQVLTIGLEGMYNSIIKWRGDTDTNCSIAGQIAGALLGGNNIPEHLLDKLKELSEYIWIDQVVKDFKIKQNQ